MNRQYEAKTARNADVITDWNAGCTQSEIAKRHGISKGRVAQIMRSEYASITRTQTPNRQPLRDYGALQRGFISGTNHSSPHSAIQAGERTLAEWCDYVGSWRIV